MPTIKTKKKQNLIDIAVQNFGSDWVNGVLNIVKSNEISLAEELTDGKELDIIGVNENDLSLRYLKDRGVEVVTSQYINKIAAPTNLQIDLVLDDRIDLSWVDNSDNENGFQIERSIDGGINWDVVFITEENTNSYSVDELNPETEYHFRIIGIGNGQGEYSNIVSGTTLFALVLSTTINPSIGTPFNPKITYLGIDPVSWVFENGYLFEGDQIIDSDGILTGLNGSEQVFKILVSNSSLITSFVSDLDGITGGVVDLVSLNGLTDLSLSRTDNVTTINLPPNIYSRIKVDRNQLTSLDLSQVDFLANASLDFFGNNNLPNPTWRAGNYSGSMQRIYGYTCLLSGLLPLNKFSSANNCLLWFDNNINITGVDFGNNMTSVKKLEIEGCNLLSCDLSNVGFTNDAEIYLSDNFNLSLFTQPNSGHNGSIKRLDIGRNGIVGSLDISNVNFADDFTLIASNPSPASGNIDLVSFPAYVFPKNCGSIRLNDNDLLSLDISWANFNIRSRLSLQNTKLAVLSTPVSMTGSFASIDITESTLSTIDLSWIVMDSNQSASGDNGSFNLYNNLSLQNIDLPTSSPVPYDRIYMEDCDWVYEDGDLNIAGIYDKNNCGVRLKNNGFTESEVNRILVDIDSSASSGFTGRFINITGTNAAPDSTSGGNDGDAAVTSLVAKGFTVTTS